MNERGTQGRERGRQEMINSEATDIKMKAIYCLSFWGKGSENFPAPWQESMLRDPKCGRGPTNRVGHSGPSHNPRHLLASTGADSREFCGF